MSEDLLKPGDTAGPYRIVGRIGRGGMGDVYRALEPALERTVALKVMGGGLAQDRSFVERFKTEAKAAAALIHPNIINVFGVGEVKGMPYIAMEFVDGESLQQKILREKRLVPAVVLEWAVQACRGLEAAARKGVVHRDIKPANLMVDREGNLKVADFGLAKLQKSDVSLTQTGVAVGTPLYMSPEQGRGEQIDLRSDMYSLGATVYHALSGKPPFEADSPLAVISKHALTPVTPLHVVRADIPQPVSGVISRMMAKAPADRYAAYDSLIAELERLKAVVPKAPAGAAARTGGAASPEDLAFGKVAVKSGMITEAQYRGALGLQEKLRAAGKPVKGLAEILVAAKIITPDQREILQNSGLHKAWEDATEESDASNPTLEVTEHKRAESKKAEEAKGPVCVLCKLEVRPEQVQTVCEECGARQHAECYTSFGGCGNEQCQASPRSVVGRKSKDEPITSRPLTFKERLAGMMWPIIGTAVLLLVGFLVWKFTYKSATDLYNEAKALEGSRDARLSIFSIDAANRDANATSALSGEVQRRLEQQIGLYTKALDKEERFVPARYELARCLQQLGRKEDALRELERVLTYDARHKEAMLGAGVLHLAAGNDSKAEAYLQKAAEAGVTEAWLNLAILFQDRYKKNNLAIAPLREYLKKFDADGNAWARLSSALFDSGNDREAGVAADRAAMTGATIPLGVLVRARIAFKGGNFEEAAAAAVAAAEKSEQSSLHQFEAYRLAGQAYLKAGKPQPARQVLYAARAISPLDVDVTVALADLAAALGEWGDAGNQYYEAFNRGSKNFEHLFLAGKYAYTQSQAGNAPTYFEELARRKADYPDIKLWLARAYLKSGALESAGPAVQKAFDENPEDPERQSLKIWELSVRANFQEAADLAEKYLAAHPENASLHIRAGEAYSRLRKNENAVQHWRAAIDAGDVESLYVLAEYYMSVADRARASEFYNRYVEKQALGPQAERARQVLQSLSTGTGSTTGVVWEPILAKALSGIAKPAEARYETVDLVYYGAVAALLAAYVRTEKFQDAAAVSGDLGVADVWVEEGLTRFNASTPAIQADMRVRRIRERFGQLASLCDRLVVAFAAVGGKINPGAETAIDAIANAYTSAAPSARDPFDKTALALDHIVKIMLAARGDKGAEAREFLEAQLLVASNSIQVCVARTYTICRLVAMGHAKEAEWVAELEKSDETVATGLGQMRVGFVQLARILDASR
ncbi:MAG: protein kinase [Planctomycetes bacterium]|nr:protein kinase [Planctomycetota bacterium]